MSDGLGRGLNSAKGKRLEIEKDKGGETYTVTRDARRPLCTSNSDHDLNCRLGQQR